MKTIFLLSVIAISVLSCSKDPLIDEIGYFSGEFRVDSIKQVTATASKVFTTPGTVVLKKHPETDTISAFGETTIVEPGVDENTLIFSKALYSFNFVKKFTNQSFYCVDSEGDNFVAYWFPDLNQQRLTFWTLCGSGNYRAVLTVKKLDKNRQVWTYVEATDLGLKDNVSALTAKELIYVTRK